MLKKSYKAINVFSHRQKFFFGLADEQVITFLQVFAYIPE